MVSGGNVTLKSVVLDAVAAGRDRVSVISPLTAVSGTLAVSLCCVSMVNAALTPPNCTVVTLENPLPLMTMLVPGGAVVGVNPVTASPSAPAGTGDADQHHGHDNEDPSNSPDHGSSPRGNRTLRPSRRDPTPVPTPIWADRRVDWGWFS